MCSADEEYLLTSSPSAAAHYTTQEFLSSKTQDVTQFIRSSSLEVLSIRNVSVDYWVVNKDWQEDEELWPIRFFPRIRWNLAFLEKYHSYQTAKRMFYRSSQKQSRMFIISTFYQTKTQKEATQDVYHSSPKMYLDVYHS